MLYKNDEPVELDAKDVERVRKFFHNKFPVKVVYPPERIVKSRLPHNKLPDKPNSISFDLKSTVKTQRGSEVWRYADDVIYDGKGKRKYVPKKFRFDGKRYLDRDDIELIYFLLEKCEHRMYSDEELKKNPFLKQPRQPKFIFEDLVTEAEKKAEAKALESKITVLLYNKDLGLPEERLRKVAKAYGVRGVDTLTLAQVKILLENKIHDKKFGGPDKFFDMVNADDELDARSAIQNVIDNNLIFYDAPKTTWFWNTEGEKGKTQICRVSRADIPMEVLYERYKGDNSFKEDIDALNLSKSKRIKKNAGTTIEE